MCNDFRPLLTHIYSCSIGILFTDLKHLIRPLRQVYHNFVILYDLFVHLPLFLSRAIFDINNSSNYICYWNSILIRVRKKCSTISARDLRCILIGLSTVFAQSLLIFNYNMKRTIWIFSSRDSRSQRDLHVVLKLDVYNRII